MLDLRNVSVSHSALRTVDLIGGFRMNFDIQEVGPNRFTVYNPTFESIVFAGTGEQCFVYAEGFTCRVYSSESPMTLYQLLTGNNKEN